MRYVKATAAAVVMTLLVFGVPIGLVGLIGNPTAAITWTGPISDQMILGLLSILAWVFWAQMVIAVAVEVVNQTPALRGGRDVLRVPASGGQQQLARILVAALFAAGAAGTASTVGGPLPMADAAAGHTAATAMVHSTGATHTRCATTHRFEHSDAARLRRVVVDRGDTLWSLAEQHLGSGQQWRAIADLNRGRDMGGTIATDQVLRDQLLPGWLLRMPASATGLPYLDDRPDGQRADGTYRVEPGDTLSQIAEDQLDDANRWPQIYEASTQITQPDGRHLVNPDEIDVGWTLRLAERLGGDHRGNRAATVRQTPQQPPRQTSSGPPSAHPEHSTPPLPQSQAHAPQRPRSGASAPAARATPGPASEHGYGPASRRHVDGQTGGQTGPRAGEQGDPAGGRHVVHLATETAHGDATSAPWMLAGLTGAGTGLAAGMLLALRRRRRAQFRSRRPGRTVAVPPPELVGAEKSIVALGGPQATTMEFMDAALRRLAAARTTAGEPMPSLAAVELTTDTLVLHLSESADLPGPWTNDGARLHWVLGVEVELEDVGPHRPGQPAPWPMLVTIGQSAAGDQWLLNCEELATVRLVGDPGRALAFARYLAAEVALNPWSRDVRAECVGVGDGAAAMNPARVRIRPGGKDADTVVEGLLADALATVDRCADLNTTVVPGRVTGAGEELWPGRLLLIDPHVLGSAAEALDELVGLTTGQAGRTGTAVVLTDAPTHSSASRDSDASDREREAVIELAADGQLRMPIAGLELTAVGLTREEAEGCAAVLAQAGDLHDVPVPVADGSGSSGGIGGIGGIVTCGSSGDSSADWQTYVDQAGALRAAQTVSREVPVEEIGEPVSSLLEDRDEVYVATSATVAEDLAALAPQVPARVREQVETADATLDADVTDWFADACRRPRLDVLGPLRARTRGNAVAVADRKRYYTELLAYLAIHPDGVTTSQTADAFQIAPGTVRRDMNILREWLGPNPFTGEKNPPDARKSRAALERGTALYQLDDLLCNGDLFLRLRARGQARGPAGFDDLWTALRMVAGAPFAGVDSHWLVDGDRVDQHLRVAVLDVAHITTVHALHQSDLERARNAAELAVLVAPHDEVPLLDLVALRNAEGHRSEADRIVREELRDYWDDEEPPTDLSERTEEILRRWADEAAS